MLPIEFLRPSPLQPRRRFAEDELAALAESIRERGVLQPLLVRPGAGRRQRLRDRRRRAPLAGRPAWPALHEVPVVVRELSDRERSSWR